MRARWFACLVVVGAACSGGEAVPPPEVPTSKIEVVKAPAAAPTTSVAKQRVALPADSLLPNPPPGQTIGPDDLSCTGDCAAAQTALFGADSRRDNLVVPPAQRAQAMQQFASLCEMGNAEACAAGKLIEKVDAGLDGGPSRYRYRYAQTDADGTVIAEEVLCDIDDGTYLPATLMASSSGFFSKRFRDECGAGGYRAIPDDIRPARVRLTLRFGSTLQVLDMQGSTDPAVRKCADDTAARSKWSVRGICRLTIPIP